METINYKSLADLEHGRPISELLKECEYTTNEGLESEFLAARQKLLSLMTMLQLVSYSKMLGTDNEQLPPRNRGPFLRPGPGLDDVRATFDGAGYPTIDHLIQQYEAVFGVTSQSG